MILQFTSETEACIALLLYPCKLFRLAGIYQQTERKREELRVEVIRVPSGNIWQENIRCSNLLQPLVRKWRSENLQRNIQQYKSRYRLLSLAIRTCVGKFQILC